jgi:hypothetical protein
MTSRRRERATSNASKSGSGDKLANDFLSRLDRSWERHGSEYLDRVYAERPQLYFKALVKLAILDIEPSRLNDFDPPRNREDAIQRLNRQAGIS